MAINNTPRGMFIGGNRQAMIVIHGDEAWVEIYSIEDLPNGQWHRNSHVSTPLSDQHLPQELIDQLPRYNESEIPSDFFMGQGEITAQMYQVYDSRFQHPAMAITKRVNYWKARKFAYGIRAWYILDGVKGLLAQFPNASTPSFYSWDEFAEAMNTHFSVKHKVIDSGDNENYTGFYSYDEKGNRLTEKK